MFNFNEKKIAIIGLGYVGLPLAVEFSKKSPVMAFDIDDNRILELKNHIDKTLEISTEGNCSPVGLATSFRTR
jgi:UDP-N-acetyl-D-galactosamine dehydrogenase